MFEASRIKQMIEAALPGSVAVVVDEANDGEHFVADVMSPTFEGRSLVAQHQEVYRALGRHMGTDIHALALKTFTPDQWSRAGKESK